MSRRQRKSKVRGKHSAANPNAPKATSVRKAPFTLRTIQEAPLYDQIASQMGLNPAANKIYKKTDIMEGIRYRDTNVPIYGVNAPDPFKPEKEQKDLEY